MVWSLMLLIFPACQDVPSELDALNHDPDAEAWIDLFNGENLEGWDLKIRGYPLNENFGETFRVDDGLMKIRYDGYVEFEDRFGHIFYEEPFSHYRLVVEYRFVGEQVLGGPGWAFRNNGIMFHSQSAESMGLDQDFPISIEAQLLGGDGDNERSTANMCSPGTHIHKDGRLVTDHCVDSRGGTYHGDQWVTVELLVLGDDLIQHILEGEVVMEYNRPVIGGPGVNQFDPAVKRDGQILDHGYIGLQAESHPTDIRSVRLLNLKGCMDPSATNYQTYFVEDDPATCTYE